MLARALRLLVSLVPYLVLLALLPLWAGALSLPLCPVRGLRVEALQRALNCRGAGLKVDGVYGSATERAVKKYGEG